MSELKGDGKYSENLRKALFGSLDPDIEYLKSGNSDALDAITSAVKCSQNSIKKVAGVPLIMGTGGEPPKQQSISFEQMWKHPNRFIAGMDPYKEDKERMGLLIIKSRRKGMADSTRREVMKMLGKQMQFSLSMQKKRVPKFASNQLSRKYKKALYGTRGRRNYTQCKYLETAIQSNEIAVQYEICRAIVNRELQKAKHKLHEK